MIEKRINGGDYQPTLTDKIVLDSVPTVNSLNGVTSDAVARAVAGASGEVPQVTENDNGKVLKAVYDEGGPAVEWAEGGSDYSAGTGVAISDQGAISVKIDGSTITTNGEGQLVAAGGGAGDSPAKTGGRTSLAGTTKGMITAAQSNGTTLVISGDPAGYLLPNDYTSSGDNSYYFIPYSDGNGASIYGIQLFGIAGVANDAFDAFYGSAINPENAKLEIIIQVPNGILNPPFYAVYNEEFSGCLGPKEYSTGNFSVKGKYLDITPISKDPSKWTFYNNATAETFASGTGYIWVGIAGTTGNPARRTPHGTSALQASAEGNKVVWAANRYSSNDTLYSMNPVIPAFTNADAGKVLAVNSAGSGLEWKSLT